MVEKADILLENFAPGVMDRLGVGYEVLSRINPRLVYASGTGYGLSGPDRDNLAMDLTIQAMGGLISVTGFPDGPPLKSGPAVVDFLSGIHLYAATITALFERERTGTGPPGRGRDAGGRLRDPDLAARSLFGRPAKVPPRTGNASHGRVPINVYPTNDGYVAMNLAVEEHWHSLLKAMGREDLRDDPRFNRNAARVSESRRNRRADRRLDADARQDGGLRDRQAAPHPAGAGARCRRGHARPAHARARLSRGYRARRDRPDHGAELAVALPRRRPGRSASRARSSASTTTRSMAAGSACRRRNRSSKKRRDLRLFSRIRRACPEDPRGSPGKPAYDLREDARRNADAPALRKTRPCRRSDAVAAAGAQCLGRGLQCGR